MEDNISAFPPKATQPLREQIFGEINGYTFEVCNSEESKQTAYELRYRSYLKEYPGLSSEDELIQDEYDDRPNVRTHLIWNDGMPVATVRGCIWSDEYDWEMPESVTYFKRELVNSIGQVRLLESNRYAVAPEFQGRQSLFAQLLCFRIHALNSALHKCTHIITSVVESHAPFYKRFLDLDVFCKDTKNIEWLKADVVLLMANRDQSMTTALKRGMPDFTLEDQIKYAKAAKFHNQ